MNGFLAAMRMFLFIIPVAALRLSLRTQCYLPCRSLEAVNFENGKSLDLPPKWLLE